LANDYIIVIMCQKILIVLALLMLVLSEGPSIKVEGTRTGGFTQVPLEEADELAKEAVAPLYKEIEAFVRKELAASEYFKDRTVGKLLKLEVQVVSGMNYRYTFEDQNGDRFSATIFDQPWTNTRRLAHINFSLTEEM
jgi:hypothetical protein